MAHNIYARTTIKKEKIINREKKKRERKMCKELKYTSEWQKMPFSITKKS